MLGTLGTGISGLRTCSNELNGGVSYATRPCAKAGSGTERAFRGSWTTCLLGGASNIRLGVPCGSGTEQPNFG